MLKAYLISRNEDFGRTHNLEFLLQLCGKYDQSFLKCELGDLSTYAVGIRYPDDFYIPDLIEARKAYELATGMKTIVFAKLAAYGI